MAHTITTLIIALFGYSSIKLATLLLNEYQKQFNYKPKDVLSFEILLQLLFHPAGTPGFLVAGAIFIGISCYFIAFIFVAVPFLALPGIK